MRHEGLPAEADERLSDFVPTSPATGTATSSASPAASPSEVGEAAARLPLGEEEEEEAPVCLRFRGETG